jgi:hypothetical protein
MNDKMESMWKHLWLNSGGHPVICLETHGKTTKNLNLGPPEYKEVSSGGGGKTHTHTHTHNNREPKSE